MFSDTIEFELSRYLGKFLSILAMFFQCFLCIYCCLMSEVKYCVGWFLVNPTSAVHMKLFSTITLYTITEMETRIHPVEISK